MEPGPGEGAQEGQGAAPALADADAVGRRWESAGEHYATDRWKGRRAKTRDQELVARLLGRLPKGDPPIDSVLDVPCGAGRMRNSIPAPWAGVDISPTMIAEASTGSGTVMRGSATDLPFASGTFDAVLCCRLIHHYPGDDSGAADRMRVLDELFRVARRYILLSYWDAQSLTAWRRRTRGPLRRRKGHGVRFPIPWRVLRAEIEARGGEVLGRAFSMRFVSAQTFVLVGLPNDLLELPERRACEGRQD